MTKDKKRVLCGRDLSDFGEEPRFCGKPIRTPNASELCDAHLARLPFWPVDKKREG